MKDLAGILVAGFLFIIALLLLPRLFNSIAAQNAALSAQYSPTAAWQRSQAQWIGAVGDIGTSVLNNFAESHDATSPNY